MPAKINKNNKKFQADKPGIIAFCWWSRPVLDGIRVRVHGRSGLIHVFEKKNV
ncbi:MAG: hypothetical protein K5694_03990 [Bacilli bacterium]|nr:hypothetical protein [Bacilli bacterium]